VIFRSCGDDETSNVNVEIPPNGNRNAPIGELDPEPMMPPGLPDDITGDNPWLKLNAQQMPVQGNANPNDGPKNAQGGSLTNRHLRANSALFITSN